MAKKRHKLSDEGRQKIREAQRKRWDAYKSKKDLQEPIQNLQKQAEKVGTEGTARQ